MTIALLATGDELINGDTLNTTTQQIAHALHSEGLETGLHLSCSDKEQDIHQCITFLAQKHSTIIITGGLGPTSDDRTRFAVSQFLGVPLVDFPVAMEHIQQRLNRHSLALSKGNQQQAKFPAEAQILPNPHGTAMGCWCVKNNLVLILLPGPPRECMPMFNDFVFEPLKSTGRSSNILLKWRVFGVAESAIAEQLDSALKHLDCETGYRLETPYVECKIRCHPRLQSEVERIILPIIKPHIIATTHKKASEQLYEAILQHEKPIAILDEVTGGLLQLLIQRPGNYPLLTFYENQAAEIHFHLLGLKEYWTGQQPGGTTTLSINYRFGPNDGQETHVLPYRSPLVIHHAAEWLSFRLFHLINELHQ